LNSVFCNILWRIGSMQKMLSYGGLGERAQRESCRFNRRVARRQLWRLGWRKRKWEWCHIPHSFRCNATLGKHARHNYLISVATIFYCLRFKTSFFVASYDSQGHGGGIRPRLQTGLLHTQHSVRCSLYRLSTDHMENTLLLGNRYKVLMSGVFTKRRVVTGWVGYVTSLSPPFTPSKRSATFPLRACPEASVAE
jgi:hypothetical protein